MGATEQGPAAASGDDIDPRSVYEIVWSCVAVVFACTWVAIHPNVPPKHIRTSRWRRLRRRVCLMIWALLVPELMVMWAVGQWSSADIVSREFGDKLKGKDKKSTRAHGFFLVMGGFSSFRRGQSVPGTSPIDDASPDAVEVRRIYPEDLYGSPLNPLIDRRIPCPGITRDRIDDKSKGDGLAKALVVLQTTWFVLQVLFRFVENIAITELEIVTLAYAMMGGMMYVFWWNKPLDVLLPVPVYTAVYRVDRTESVFWWNQPLNVLLPLPMYTSTAQYLAGRPNMAKSVFESSRWIDRAVEIIKGETILRLHAKVVDEPTSMFTSLMTPHQAHERRTVVISAAASTVFGAIHCLASILNRPTSLEGVLWLVSSVLVSVTPLAWVAIGWMINHATYEKFFILAPRKRTAIPLFFFSIFLYSYFIARVFLIVQAFLFVELNPMNFFVNPTCKALLHMQPFKQGMHPPRPLHRTVRQGESISDYSSNVKELPVTLETRHYRSSG